MKYYRVICSKCKKVLCTVAGKNAHAASYYNYSYIRDKCCSHKCLDKNGILNVDYKEIRR